MSLYLDQKYLSLISNRLPLFKKKDDRLYNCRCVICGDSTKNQRKARGYFFSYKNELRYKCHNCDASLAFGSFLKTLDSGLFSQYSLEKYSESNTTKISKDISNTFFPQPVFATPEETLLDGILDRIDTLPDDNEAVQFCKKRMIPAEAYLRLYYINNIKDIVQLNDTYKESIRGEEPRLAMPFYDEKGQLTGVTCRALRGETLRYITIKIKNDVPLLFGINELNKQKTVYVVEGPIDSLFLPNCIAAAGTSFGKINSIGVDQRRLVLVFDNQPRNKEVCKIIEKNMDAGYRVVIWPQSIEEKDINDMVLAGRNVAQIVEKNTYQGLTARAKYMAWKRC